MFVYIITIGATFLAFMAFLSSLRFLISRQSVFWILPLLISLILTYQDLNVLLAVGDSAAITNPRITFSFILPFFLSLFWYAFIIIFHYALKMTIAENKYINDSKKNIKEARYIEKYEIRASKKKSEEKKKKGSRNTVPVIKPYHEGKLVD